MDSEAPVTMIAGGGLSGMTTALRLCERGIKTRLIESTDRFGGKCGATRDSKHENEHSYHLFPAWYANFSALLAELGVRERLRDLPIYSFLRAGEFPKAIELENFLSPRNFVRNLFSGFLSPAETVLYVYSLLDLVSYGLNRRSFLDHISVNGLIRSRWYATENVARGHEEVLFKTFAVPVYQMSAMSYQKTFKFWLSSPVPTIRMFRGDVHSELIEPFTRVLAEKGCILDLETEIERIELAQGAVRRVLLKHRPSGVASWESVERLVLALPPEKVRGLVTDELYEADPKLGELHHLRSQNIASTNVYFSSRIPDMPFGVVSLLGSTYGLTFVDNSQLWEKEGPTFLNVVSSRFTPLASLTPREAQAKILEDLKRFVPFDDGDIDYVDHQSHDDQPLFSSLVGSWRHRPKTRSSIRNLYFCGDYCRSHVDVISVEGAVTTGLEAASAVVVDLGVGDRVVIEAPFEYPRWLFLLGKLLLSPFALLARLWVGLVGARPLDGTESD